MLICLLEENPSIKMEIQGKVCRTCLKGNTKLFPLDVKFENELQGRKMLEYLIGGNILDSEDFSEICDSCRTTLIVSCTFKQQCILSEEKITEYLLSSDSTDIPKEEETLEENYDDSLVEEADTCAELVIPKDEDDNESTHSEFLGFDAEDVPESSPEKNSRNEDSFDEQTEKSKAPKSDKTPAGNPRKCTRCKIFFPDLPAYQRHYKISHRKRKGATAESKEKTYSREEKNSRQMDEKIRQCGTCNITFQGINKYKNHYYHVHMKKSVKKPRSDSSEELEIEDGQEMNTTQKTGRATKQKKEQKSGMTCRQCELFFSDVKEYRTHYWHEHAKNQPGSKKKAICEDCGKTVSLCRIKIHRMAHRGKSFFCSICSMGFTMKENLTVHMRIHNQEKKFTCKYCNESFVHWRTRKTHILKYHETDKQPEAFECTMCDKKFGQKYYLDFHMRKHRGDLRHECSVCQKRFISAYAMKRHFITHTGEKNVICSVCGKAFGTKGILKLHMVTHTGERNYECEVCGRAFTQCHVLRTHMRTTHPEHPVPPPRTVLKKNPGRMEIYVVQETQEPTQVSENEQVLKYEEEDCISEQSAC